MATGLAIAGVVATIGSTVYATETKKAETRRAEEKQKKREESAEKRREQLSDLEKAESQSDAARIRQETATAGLTSTALPARPGTISGEANKGAKRRLGD